ncbi:DNA-binding XRE family transcriptional regulator [Deinococcus frigens]
MDNHIRTLRAARQWTQADLAAELDVSRQTVNALETGKYDPSLPLAFRIARLFGRPIEDIFIDPDRPGESVPVAASVPEPGFDYQTRTAIALNELGILREMGEQGWELTGVGLGTLSFRRAVGQQDAAPRWLYQRLSGLLSSEQRQELTQQGWTLVDTWLGGVFHYFRRPLP